MKKFTMSLTSQQEAMLDGLQAPLGAATRTDVIRKALSLLELYAELRAKNQNLVIADADGTPLQRIRVI